MKGDFIVSLASYSKRIQTLHICLESIFSQTLMPKKVLLYLDSSVTPEEVPLQVMEFTKRGLEIFFVSDDIASHNKYFYTFLKYPNEIIITTDDDVIYNKNTFQNLLQTHKKFPTAVCASRVTYITFNSDNTIASYNDWISEYNKLLIPSKRLVAIGVGGVLYPPNIFTDELFDKSNIKKLALTADDLWLKIMQLRKGISVVWTGQLPQHPPQIPNTRDVGLWRTINKFKNDEYIRRIVDYYQLDLYSLTTKEEEFLEATTINNHNSCI